MVAGCPCACGDSLLPLSTSTKAQSSGQNGHNHNRLYQFQSISPPFVASCTARVGSHTDNNVFVKFFGCIAGDSIQTTKHDSRVMLTEANGSRPYTWRRRAPAPFPQIPDATRASRLQSRTARRSGRQADGVKFESLLDNDRRTLIDHFEQFDHVLVTHPHAAVARSRADFVLVFGAMNVDEAVARIRIVLVQSVEPQNT